MGQNLRKILDAVPNRVGGGGGLMMMAFSLAQMTGQLMSSSPSGQRDVTLHLTSQWSTLFSKPWLRSLRMRVAVRWSMHTTRS